jgi:serine phosphatase RsbU (regulator of sigma subunit)
MFKHRIIIYSLSILFLIFFGNRVFSQVSTDIRDNNAKAEEFLEQGNKAEAARLYTQTAYYYRNTGDLKKAIDYYLKVLDLNTELGNRVGQMLTHSNLAMLYIESEQYASALKHLKAELNFREANRSLKEILPVLLSISSVHVELNEFDAAVETVERAISMAKEINELPLLKRSYGVAFDIYTKWGKQDKAQSYFEFYSAIDRKIKEDQMVEVKSQAQQKVSVANSEKAKTEQQLTATNNELQQTVVTLHETEQIKREQEMELNLQQALINEQNALLHLERLRKRFFAIGFVVALLFIIALGFLILKIVSANKKIESQRLRLEKQNHEIKSSINYAETIQKAMLTDLNEVSDFGDGFVLYRPKDIVSGDFYWSAKLSDTRMFFAVVDCTGHGVPGAFMSMIGIRMLSEIVVEMKVESTAVVLENLNEMIREALRQEQTDNNDGMDCVIVCLDKQPNGATKVTYSGAKRPLYITRKSKNALEVLNPDRKSIGGHQPAKRYIEFSNQSVILNPGDEIFLFTDGIVDQNDPFRKKFGRARLENILVSISEEDISKQKQIIEQKLDDFIREEAQRDDITLAGFKIK